MAGLLVGIFGFAGPLLTIACTLAGGFLAALAATFYTKRNQRDTVRNSQLDREIGVIGGDIGARR
jgi:hypothetical protein